MQRRQTIILVSYAAFLFALACFGAYVSADEPTMNSPRKAWVNVPNHGTVWLRPGDAYEHHSGLVRDRNGRHYRPLRPSHSRNNAPSPTRWQPITPPQPHYPMQPTTPSPVYRPRYQPAFPNYVRPSCPNCLDHGPYRPGRAIGSIDVMNQIKTGDAPLNR